MHILKEYSNNYMKCMNKMLFVLVDDSKFPIGEDTILYVI